MEAGGSVDASMWRVGDRVGALLEETHSCLVWVSLEVLVEVKQKVLQLDLVLAPVQLVDPLRAAALDLVQLELRDDHLARRLTLHRCLVGRMALVLTAT